MQSKIQTGFFYALSLSIILAGYASARAQAPASTPPAPAAPAPVAAPAQLPKARSVKIAVIDIEKTFNSLDERTQIQADLSVMAEKFAQEGEQMNQEIKNLEEDLKMLEPTSPQFSAKEAALSKKAFEKQSWVTWRQNTMQREQKLRQLDLYRKINVAVAELAKENGYDVVLFKETPVENMARLNPQDQQDAMGNRKLIYFAPDLEITDFLVTRMNNDYKNSKALGATPAPAKAPASKP